jgi:hypothetical protein
MYTWEEREKVVIYWAIFFDRIEGPMLIDNQNTSFSDTENCIQAVQQIKNVKKFHSRNAQPGARSRIVQMF